MKPILASVLFTMAAATAFGANKPVTIKTKKLSGLEYVKFIAANCNEDEFKKILPQIKATNFATTDIEGREYTIDGNAVSSDGLSMTFAGEKLKATVGGKTYEGTVCEVVTQTLQPEKKSAALRLLIPSARAEEVFLPTTKTEQVIDRITSNPARTAAVIAGVGVAGATGMWTLCTMCSDLPSALIDEEELARNRLQLQGLASQAFRAEDKTVIACNEGSFTIRGSGITAVVNRRTHQMTISNGRVTGNIATNVGFGPNYEGGMESCRTNKDAEFANRANAEARRVARQIRDGNLDGIILPSHLRRPGRDRRGNR